MKYALLREMALSALETPIRTPPGKHLDDARKTSQNVRGEAADAFTLQVAPKINEARLKGYSSLRAIAEYLNMEGVKTRMNTDWNAVSVRDTVKRFARLSIEKRRTEMGWSKDGSRRL